MKPFEEKSKRAQYAAAKQIWDTHEAPAIILAAAQSQSLATKKDASFVMRKVGSKTGLTAAKAKPAAKEMIKIAPEKGLAFLLNNNFSRAQYEAVQFINFTI